MLVTYLLLLLLKKKLSQPPLTWYSVNWNEEWFNAASLVTSCHEQPQHHLGLTLEDLLLEPLSCCRSCWALNTSDCQKSWTIKLLTIVGTRCLQVILQPATRRQMGCFGNSFAGDQRNFCLDKQKAEDSFSLTDVLLGSITTQQQPDNESLQSRKSQINQQK